MPAPILINTGWHRSLTCLREYERREVKNKTKKPVTIYLRFLHPYIFYKHIWPEMQWNLKGQTDIHFGTLLSCFYLSVRQEPCSVCIDTEDAFSGGESVKLTAFTGKHTLCCWPGNPAAALQEELGQKVKMVHNRLIEAPSFIAGFHLHSSSCHVDFPVLPYWYLCSPGISNRAWLDEAIRKQLLTFEIHRDELVTWLTLIS